MSHICVEFGNVFSPRAFEASHLSPEGTRAHAGAHASARFTVRQSQKQQQKKKGQKETNSRTAAARQLESAWYLQDLGGEGVDGCGVCCKRTIIPPSHRSLVRRCIRLSRPLAFSLERETRPIW